MVPGGSGSPCPEVMTGSASHPPSAPQAKTHFLSLKDPLSEDCWDRAVDGTLETLVPSLLGSQRSHASVAFLMTWGNASDLCQVKVLGKSIESSIRLGPQWCLCASGEEASALTSASAADGPRMVLAFFFTRRISMF